jgi:hypothetical protein
MLALQPQSLLNKLAASNPLANCFAKAGRAASAAGFVVYCGILSATVAVWMWMSHKTTLQPRTIPTGVAVALICSPSVSIHPSCAKNP